MLIYVHFPDELCSGPPPCISMSCFQPQTSIFQHCLHLANSHSPTSNKPSLMLHAPIASAPRPLAVHVPHYTVIIFSPVCCFHQSMGSIRAEVVSYSLCISTSPGWNIVPAHCRSSLDVCWISKTFFHILTFLIISFCIECRELEFLVQQLYYSRNTFWLCLLLAMIKFQPLNWKK